jgi:hypothetical protein
MVTSFSLSLTSFLLSGKSLIRPAMVIHAPQEAKTGRLWLKASLSKMRSHLNK